MERPIAVRAIPPAAALSPGPRLYLGRVPCLGARRVPGRPPAATPACPGQRPRRTRGRRPRPPGSWIWRPNEKGLPPRFPWPALPGSPPRWRPSLPEHRRRSHRPTQGRPWPPGTETPDDPHVRHRPGHLHGAVRSCSSGYVHRLELKEPAAHSLPLADEFT
jgi:hypothetical protein